jgi:ABC-type branched-subunit amino acid transport system ATPase component
VRDVTLLKVSNIEAGYGDLQILFGVDLEVESKEIVTLIGPNGAGKSTLLKAIEGLIKPWAGQVFLNGEEVTGSEPNVLVKKGMGYVPQRDNIFPTLRVKENLEMGGYLRKDDYSKVINDIFALFPILEKKQQYVAGKMSGGEQHQLALGRALMMEPSILLIDEPTTGLAPNLINNLFDSLVEIKEKKKVGILMVEQNARRALSISDRGYVLDMGKNAFEGTGSQLLNDPKVEKLYLGH